MFKSKVSSSVRIAWLMRLVCGAFIKCCAILFLLSVKAQAASSLSEDLETWVAFLFVAAPVISALPLLLLTCTCFPFILICLTLLKHAIGLQQTPPNLVLSALALILTFYTMQPVFEAAWTGGLHPILISNIDWVVGVESTLSPFLDFMRSRMDTRIADGFLYLQNPEVSLDGDLFSARTIVPAFLVSELSRAFEVGFLIFLPFVVIDLVISAVLMSMGMMMVPPAMVSLPFKIAFFVAVDGWMLIATTLVEAGSI